MKKITLTLLAAALASGCISLLPTHPGRTYADAAFQGVAKDWSMKSLEEYAGPDFWRVCPQPRAAQLMQIFHDKLGPLKKYPGPSQPAPNPKQMPNATEIFTVSGVEFEKGIGNVTVLVGQHDGKWSLNGFQIGSDLLRASASTPTSLVRRPQPGLPSPTSVMTPGAPPTPGAAATPGAPLTPSSPDATPPAPAASSTPESTPEAPAPPATPEAPAASPTP